MRKIKLFGAVCLLLLNLLPLQAWDYTYHRVVNQLALTSLPQDFPAFVREPAAAERIAFLSGEADRWRNTPENGFKHSNGPDHYLDWEDIVELGLKPESLSAFRYEFTAQFAAAREKHAAQLPPIDPRRNSDKTRELSGFLPWTIAEYYAKVKAGFSYQKVFEELGTPEEIANARQNLVYVMGVMGHFVGDTTQPLHTTKHFNGWVGANPNGYTTARTLHAWLDSGYLDQVGLDVTALKKQVRPAKVLRPAGAAADDLFPDMVQYFLQQHQLVETVYRMEKAGEFSGQGDNGMKGRELLSQQLLKAGQMLGDLWLTAYRQASDDTFLRDQLLKRKAVKASAGK